MKYLCLCYYDADAFANLDPAEAQAIGPACRPHDAALKATGKLIVQGSLSMPDAWTHFVPKSGKPALARGPYVKGGNRVCSVLTHLVKRKRTKMLASTIRFHGQ